MMVRIPVCPVCKQPHLNWIEDGVFAICGGKCDQRVEYSDVLWVEHTEVPDGRLCRKEWEMDAAFFFVCKRCGKRRILRYDSVGKGFCFGCLQIITEEWQALKKEVEELKEGRISRFRLPKGYLDEEPME
ncbi:MAG: hypothetical protein V3W28_01410 [Thermoplasmata archaeon]